MTVGQPHRARFLDFVDCFKLLTLRLKPETIAKFKATGKGWQTRMSDTLDRSEV